MLAFIAYLVAAITFFGVGHKDLVEADLVWGFFFVALGLVFSTLPVVYTNYRNRNITL